MRKLRYWYGLLMIWLPCLLIFFDPIKGGG